MKFTAALMHGKLWMPLDELIEFFDEMSKDNKNPYQSLDRFTSLALASIKEKCEKDPDMIMTEEEFLKKQSEN